MTDTKTEIDYVELGREFLTALLGGEPTIDRLLHAIACDRQEARQQIRLVTENGEEVD